MSDSGQGAAYTEYIADQLAAEHARRVSLQGRAQWLLSSSTTLLTLMTAVVVFLQFSGPRRIPGWLQAGYFIAVTALIVAVTAGIWAGRAYRYRVADESTLSAMLDTHWGDDQVDSRNIVARLRVAEITSLRHGNNLMARWALAGQLAQLVFVILFVLCALFTVTLTDIAGTA
ncbi:hypothetical protein Afil01_44690 [Actinorhabdospora filicis]|uniref:Uncharacterized protein n=1 Tax=Actinorhabdospora filicis TaxID=1785913 RepID=A0A9W6SPD6_9ACTN|nr:hypothetical protein [Actinorhabdospora filicis]GLZ79662.1 hypothetical protein Afil01_44690 [Actinorhabdospora filicis]